MLDVVLYYIVSVLFLLFVRCPCMAIKVNNVQYNGGLLPDSIVVVVVIVPHIQRIG